MRIRRGFSVCGWGSLFYQSYGWNNFRYLGSDNLVFNQLERHGVDEILIISPSGNPIDNTNEMYDFSRLENNYIGVPVAIGGGLSEKILDNLLEKGCVERFMFSGCLQNVSNNLIRKVTNENGRQAVLGLLGLKVIDGQVFLLDQFHSTYRKLTDYDIDKAYDLCDEVIFQDLDSYGMQDCFNREILKVIKKPECSIINGGCGASIIKAAELQGVAAIYFDNLVMYSEN